MKKLNRNILLGLGSMAAVAAPVVAVVACDNPFSKESSSDEYSFKLPSMGMFSSNSEKNIEIKMKKDTLDVSELADDLAQHMNGQMTGITLSFTSADFTFTVKDKDGNEVFTTHSISILKSSFSMKMELHDKILKEMRLSIEALTDSSQKAMFNHYN